MKRGRFAVACQNSPWPLVGLLAVAVLGVGCAKAHMYHTRSAPADVAPDDGVTVVLEHFSGEFSASKEDNFAGCIASAIRKVEPTVRIVPSDEFRRAAFPDLPPEEVGHQAWERLAADPAFRQRIAPLGVQYLITLSGTTTRAGLKFKAKCGHMACGMAFVEKYGEKRSFLDATVIALRQGSKVGRVDAFAYSQTGSGLVILPLPLYLPSAPTESRVCRELGKGVAAVLAGEKPPAETKAGQLEDRIREGWTRAKTEDQGDRKSVV